MEAYLSQYVSLFEKIDKEKIQEVIEYLDLFDRNHKIYLIGNGGSYALAEHFAQDLLKKGNLPAIALTNGSNLTAFSNDFEYYYSFQGQLRTYIDPGDCLIVFTCSGESDNINNACSIADELGADIISFTGFNDSNRVNKQAKIDLHVPSYDYGIVESIHSIIFHYIIDQLS